MWLSMARQPAVVACWPVPKARLAGRRERCVVGGVDVEPPGADRLEPLLALRHPIGFGQLLDRECGRAGSEQRGDGGLVGLARRARQPDFEPPIIGPFLGDLAARQHHVRVPIERVFVRDERRFDHGAGGEGGDFP
jgi:hypothetical protein